MKSKAPSKKAPVAAKKAKAPAAAAKKAKAPAAAAKKAKAPSPSKTTAKMAAKMTAAKTNAAPNKKNAPANVPAAAAASKKKAAKSPAASKAAKTPAAPKKKAPAAKKAKVPAAAAKRAKAPAPPPKPKAPAGTKTKAPAVTNTAKAAPAAPSRVARGPPGSPACDTDVRPLVPCFIATQFTPYSCAVCSRPAAECTPCKSCNAVWYCSPAHERADRAAHRELCEFIVQKVVRGPKLTMADAPLGLANTLVAAYPGRLSALARDVLARIPRCIGCGVFPAVAAVCEGCGLVARCNACARTKKGTAHHPAALCDAMAASARAMRVVMVEERNFFDMGSVSRFQPPERMNGAKWKEHDPVQVFEQTMRGFAPSTAATFGLDSWRAYAHATNWTVNDLGPMTLLDGVFDYGMMALLQDQHCGPLAVFAGIMKASEEVREKIKTKIRQAAGTLVVHVVGAEFEPSVFPVWEVLLHLFAAWGVSRVAVGFIGPKVIPKGVSNWRSCTVDSNTICDDCIVHRCKATAFYYKGTYEAFCRDRSVAHEFAGFRRRSEVTIALNAGLTAFEDTPESDPWPPGLKAMVAKNRAPLNIVTAYTPDEATRDAAIFRRWAAAEGYESDSVAVSAVQPNPFRSPLFLAGHVTLTDWYAPNHSMWWFTVDDVLIATDDDDDDDYGVQGVFDGFEYDESDDDGDEDDDGHAELERLLGDSSQLPPITREYQIRRMRIEEHLRRTGAPPGGGSY